MGGFRRWCNSPGGLLCRKSAHPLVRVLSSIGVFAVAGLVGFLFWIHLAVQCKTSSA